MNHQELLNMIAENALKMKKYPIDSKDFEYCVGFSDALNWVLMKEREKEKENER